MRTGHFQEQTHTSMCLHKIRNCCCVSAGWRKNNNELTLVCMVQTAVHDSTKWMLGWKHTKGTHLPPCSCVSSEPRQHFSKPPRPQPMILFDCCPSRVLTRTPIHFIPIPRLSPLLDSSVIYHSGQGFIKVITSVVPIPHFRVDCPRGRSNWSNGVDVVDRLSQGEGWG